MKLSDYFISDKPSKLMLLDVNGEEQGDYLEVIGADSPSVAKAKAAWQTASAKLHRELEAIKDRSVDDKVSDDDIERKIEISTYEQPKLDSEFSALLVVGWSFEDEFNKDLLPDFLMQGNLSLAVIGMAFDAERLKKN